MRRLIWVVTVVASSGAGCGGDDGAPPVDAGPEGPALEIPTIIALPYVAAGAGAASLEVTVTNPGTDDATGPGGADLGWQLGDDPAFTVERAPPLVAAGGTATMTVRWSGAAAPVITGTSLTVDSNAGARTAEVWAVAGDPTLPPATFSPVMASGTAEGAAVVIGESAVVALPTAPYPATGQPWTDARVHLFVPAGYRQRDAHDAVLHFHGHNTTIDATVPAHRYREQVWASGVNAVLVVPQGPVNAASGDFGKLGDPAGTEAFLHEVITVLYRAGKLTRPVLGDVVLTSHSGGYIAVAANLDDAAAFAVRQVDLFDSLYGYLATYRDFVIGGGRLRSNYTAGGGTDTNNLSLATMLGGAGITAATTFTQAALRDAAAVIYFTAASHGDATRDDGAYAEMLRWTPLPGRRGPRAELLTATATATTATVTWRSPPDPDLTGWRVELSLDGLTWATATEVGAAATAATFPVTGAVRVRLVPITIGVADAVALPTDTYAVAPDAAILVVDGFDRAIDGSFSGLAHDLAGRVGQAARLVHTISNEAVIDGGFALTPYRVVIWLVGDESTDDHTFTAAERAAVDTYLAGGGRVIISGSEIGYELGPTTAGGQWLARVAGAVYASDDAGTTIASGTGALSTVPAFAFGTATAAYVEEYPDAYTITGAGEVVLRYSTGGAAAVGVRGRAVIVGFPLEVIEQPGMLAKVIDELRAFVDP